jgi:misacylated tRNA(Ala) deacylase
MCRQKVRRCLQQVNRSALHLDWPRRHRLMRVHTALHLMCALVPYPVTGGQIGEDGGRLDFDIDNPDAIDKDELTAKLQQLVAADHKVSQRWITDAELDANPGLVRTMSVQPPRGSGRVRLVAIGEDGAVDLQPCGGTHVASTAEIGNISITKVEKKGRNNRRFRLALAD